MKTLAQSKIALVYDRVNTPYGGAERVLQAVHQIFPNAPLFTSVYDAGRANWARGWDVRPTWLQRVPGAKRWHRLLVGLMPLAFESLDLSAFDIVISITSAEAKGVLTKPHQLHLCYLLTPTRYLWSHADEYQQNWLTGWLRRWFFTYLRWWDEVAAQRPDVMIPISQLVAKRCREFYHRECAEVIYPTVLPENFATKKTAVGELPAKLRSLSGQYNLVVARLVPYKKIDLAIQACAAAKQPLVIVGAGPDLARLRSLAGGSSTIFFYSHVTNAQLPAFYAHCRFFLSPAEEDFGVTVLEAQAYGKPVITYAESGCAELVKEGVSGLHFFAHTVSDLTEALLVASTFVWDEAEIRHHVAGQSQANFQRAFKNAVEYFWHQTQQDV